MALLQKILIFLSSTSQMAEERQQLQQGLSEQEYSQRVELYRHEYDRARRETPEKRCRDLIASSDLFIGVYGKDNGSLFPGDPAGRSIVEWEFDAAQSEPNLEVFCFIKNTAEGEERAPQEQAFIARITNFRAGAWCKWFSTPADLVALARNEIAQLALERWAAFSRKRPMLARWLHGRLLPICMIAVTAALMVAVTPMHNRFSTNSLIAFSTAIICLLLSCLAILLPHM